MVDVRKLVQAYAASLTTGFWIWLGSLLFFLLVASILAVTMLRSGRMLTRQAMQDGQSVIIRISSGEMEGNPRHTKNEATPAAPEASGNVESTIISKEGLAPAPLASIAQETDHGLLPVIGHDGTMPWKYYARPFRGTQKRPMVAMIITDVGLSKRETEDTLKLPHNFTLSFTPYASDAHNWAKKAREEGFESLVDVPMERFNYPPSEAGPYGLLADSTLNENSTRLHWALAAFSGFVGLLAPMDEKFTANMTAIRPIITELAARGVLFIYVKTVQNSAFADLLKGQSFLVLGVDKAVDEDPAPSAVNAQLQSLVDLAKTNGYAIGMAHSYPSTLDALTDWSQSLDGQGVDLVPVSAIAMKAYK